MLKCHHIQVHPNLVSYSNTKQIMYLSSFMTFISTDKTFQTGLFTSRDNALRAFIRDYGYDFWRYYWRPLGTSSEVERNVGS